MSKLLSIICFAFVSQWVSAQGVIVSGTVRHSASGEPLIGAVLKAGDRYVTSNNDGFYALDIGSVGQVVECSFVGCCVERRRVCASRDTVINFTLAPDRVLEASSITARGSALLLKGLSAMDVPMEQVDRTPSLLGEKDIIRTVQLFPGVQGGLGGLFGLFVRGGGPEENLLLLDGMPLYNAEHMLGLFSTFTPEATKRVTLYKGSFPARYGGRISSVLDVRTNNGNSQKCQGSVGVNLLGSRIHVEGPLSVGRTSYSFSSRLTNTFLLGPLQKAIGETERSSYWFYDVDAKVSHRFDNNDNLSINVYNGRDYISYQDFPERATSSSTDLGLGWGNALLSGTWSHKLGARTHSDITVGVSRYGMQTSLEEIIPASQTENGHKRTVDVNYLTGIRDISLHLNVEHVISHRQTVFAGLEGIHHVFSPETYNTDISEYLGDGGTRDTSILRSSAQSIRAMEFSAYVEDEMTLSDWFSANVGLRANVFCVGQKVYLSPQPRISMAVLASERLTLTAGYSRMAQNIHLLSSTQITLPMDLWVPATENIKPVYSDQISLGTTYDAGGWSTLVECYYKSMLNVLEYKDGVPLMGNSAQWQDKVEMGEGRSYGAEFLLQKASGATTGWLAYTLSKSERRFPDGTINRGEWFPYKYDRRHSVNLVVNHKFNSKLDISGTWVFASGGVTTVPIRQTAVLSPDGGELHQTSVTYNRGNYRLPPSHSLNIGLNLHRPKRHGEGVWNFTVYNLYNQMNPDLLITEFLNETNSSGIFTASRRIKVVTLLPIIPSIGYTFNFQ